MAGLRTTAALIATAALSLTAAAMMYKGAPHPEPTPLVSVLPVSARQPAAPPPVDPMEAWRVQACLWGAHVDLRWGPPADVFAHDDPCPGKGVSASVLRLTDHHAVWTTMGL